MNDIYVEHLVKRKTPSSAKAAKAAIIIFIVLVFMVTVFIPIALVVGIVLAVAANYFFKRWDIEYEFSYIRGHLDVDKIMGKERRKKLYSFDLFNMEIMAPVKSHALDSYNSHNCKTIDYTSLMPNTKIYALVIRHNKELLKILFEPNEEILDGMKLEAPRKVSPC